MKKALSLIILLCGLFAHMVNAQYISREESGLSKKGDSKKKSQGQSSTNLEKKVGFMTDLEMTWIGGREFSNIGQGRFQAGMFVGKGKISGLFLVGFTGQTEQFFTQHTEEYYFGCGCEQVPSPKYLPLFQMVDAQLGASFQSEKAIFFLTGGVASVKPYYQEKRSFSPIFQFSGKFRGDENFLLADGLVTTNPDSLGFVFASTNISYIFGVGEERFLGLRAGFIHHIVSGQEFLIGPHGMIGIKIPESKKEILQFDLSAGAAFNPEEAEGLGFFIGLKIGINRNNKMVFR